MGCGFVLGPSGRALKPFKFSHHKTVVSRVFVSEQPAAWRMDGVESRLDRTVGGRKRHVAPGPIATAARTSCPRRSVAKIRQRRWRDMGEITCLIVEDEPAIRTYLGVVLRRRGLISLEAADAAGALRVLEEHARPLPGSRTAPPTSAPCANNNDAMFRTRIIGNSDLEYEHTQRAPRRFRGDI